MPLLLLSNRDEFYKRDAAPLHWWDGGSNLLAGRDLQAGGTWLGISRGGRLAALTNFRSGVPIREGKRSRGALVTDFLVGGMSGSEYLAQVAKTSADYNPFSLLVFDRKTLLGFESHGARVVTLEPGVGGLSNAGFNTPWPKLLRLTKSLRSQRVENDGQLPSIDRLRYLLRDTTLAPDETLPKTGIALASERTLSPIFIRSPLYGTRASSVIALHRHHALFSEESFGPAGVQGRKSITFFYAKNE
jgi:uncharacterized protein with NRDE domain